MPLIPFPNVPKLDGVPLLPRSAKYPAVVTASLLGFAQGLLWRFAQVETKWGIYDSKGNALGDPAKFSGIVGTILGTAGFGPTLSTASMGYTKETRISDFPIEKGGFVSYNKVERPANPVVTFSFDGSEQDRGSFLAAIDNAVKSTDLYSVVTPEIVYVDYSVERYGYQRRSDKGANLLIVEISLSEIRQVSAQYTQSQTPINNPKNVGATPQIDNGSVQPQAAQQSTLKSLANKITSLVQ